MGLLITISHRPVLYAQTCYSALFSFTPGFISTLSLSWKFRCTASESLGTRNPPSITHLLSVVPAIGGIIADDALVVYCCVTHFHKHTNFKLLAVIISQFLEGQKSGLTWVLFLKRSHEPSAKMLTTVGGLISKCDWGEIHFQAHVVFVGLIFRGLLNFPQVLPTLRGIGDMRTWMLGGGITSDQQAGCSRWPLDGPSGPCLLVFTA